MKGREKMIAVLEIIRCAAAVALLVVLTMYVSVKETAYEEAEESIKRAVREAGRPVVKVEVEMKGKW